MPKLSVFIITLNEEKNIREALESVSFADEIIIADSGSTDRTLEICREFNCRIFHQEWLGFGAQKNFALSKCSHEWVLSLDSDERVSPKLRDEIIQTLAAPSYDGYEITRQNYFLGKWIRYSGWYPDYLIRLFKKDSGRFKERRVHEIVEFNASPGRLKNPISHYTYHSLSDYFQRMNRYSTLAAQQMFDEGKRIGPLSLVTRPMGTFLKMFILKQGFRDGIYGLLLAGLYSCYTFAKYAKLWEITFLFRKKEK